MPDRRQLRYLCLLGALSVLTACSEDPGAADPREEPASSTPEPDPTSTPPPEPASTPPRDLAPVVDDETRAALEALGYAPRAPTDNPEERGVTRNEPGAYPGVNIFSTRHRASAQLIAMDGRVLHEWEAPPGDEDSPNRWMHVELIDAGLLALTMAGGVALHAPDSTVIWRRRIPAHHDLVVGDDGRLQVLVRWAAEISHRGRNIPILADGIMRLNADGRRIGRSELYPLFEEHVASARLDRVVARVEEGNTAGLVRGGGLGDVMHTNSIELLHTAIEGVAPAGSILLSFRTLDRVAIVNAAIDEILWIWGQDELSGQHDATQLENGNLLIFDNGVSRERSRVIEVDVRGREIVWSYEPDDFFTRLRGAAQRLPNGNTLITESDRGHAIEVTREGDIVWEFWNPDVRQTASGTERGVIYRMNRLEPEAVDAILGSSPVTIRPARGTGSDSSRVGGGSP